MKTRLTPPLTAAEALEVHTALLLDTWDCCRAQCDDTSFLCVEQDVEALSVFVGSPQHVVGHRGWSIAEGLRNTMMDHLHESPVIICTSDVPGVMSGLLNHVERLLTEGADVVLGPSFDGGWWLVALREYTGIPFDDSIPWSTPATFAATVARCRSAGLVVETLPPWPDVDTSADLCDLLCHVDELPGSRTPALLRRLHDAGTIKASPGARTVHSEILAEAGGIAVLDDQVIEPGGSTLRTLYTATPRAVAVVAMTGQEMIVVKNDYLYPVRERVLGIPWWYLGLGETPTQTVERELRKYCGDNPLLLEGVATFYAAPHLTNLRFDVLLAEECDFLPGAMPTSWESRRIGELADLVREGQSVDGPSAVALLLVARQIR